MNRPSSLSLKKQCALRIFNVKKALEAKTHELRYLFWEATLRCNCSCLHCGSDCQIDNNVADMPLHDFLKVLDSVAQNHDPKIIQVCITGGEPTLRPDLARAGAEIAKRGFSWGIVTNGLAMTKPKFNELISSGMNAMAISLDGLEAEHNWFRGKNSSYKQAVMTIEMAAQKQAKSPEFTFDVITCVHQRNVIQLEKIKKVLTDLNVRRWRLTSIFPKGRAEANGELKLTRTQMNQLMEFIKDTRNKGLIKASYSCEGFLGDYELQVRDSPFYCKAGIAIGSVLCDGSISACPSLRSDFIQGNIYQDDFCDVWENRFQIMRNRKWMKTDNCITCKVWSFCQGNGLHLREEKTGKLLHCNYEHIYG